MVPKSGDAASVHIDGAALGQLLRGVSREGAKKLVQWATGGARSTFESVLALLVNRPELAEEIAKLQGERDGMKVERDEYKAQDLTSRQFSTRSNPSHAARRRAARWRPSRGEYEGHANGQVARPKDLPRVEVRVLPPEVEREGLDAFTQIGEDVKETIEQRKA